MQLSDHSRYAQQIRQRYASQLHLLAEGVPSILYMELTFKKLLTEYSFEDGLRVLRHLVLERVLTLDCDRNLPLLYVMACVSDLAEFCLHKANEQATHELTLEYGQPSSLNEKSSNVHIMAMGKLAARELNFSSDIDLVYIYDEEGETRAEDRQSIQSISNQQYYLKWAQLIHRFISKVNDHGFVFRIDLNLRPYGAEGLKVISRFALAEYFQNTARAWERFAWYKSRSLSPKNSGYIETQRLILDFVHRKYHDYSLIDSLRNIHQNIQSSLKANSSVNVKLDRGGIREIEFGVQLLQLIRSGIEPELRSASTLNAIQLLLKARLLSAQVASQLESSYVFLRKLEHRIQYLDDTQTHDLPTNLNDLDWISSSMGFQAIEDFYNELEQHRHSISHLFSQLLANLSLDGGSVIPSEVAALNLQIPASSKGSSSDQSTQDQLQDLRTTYLNLLAWINQTLGNSPNSKVSTVCLNFFDSIDQQIGEEKKGEKRQDSTGALASSRNQKIRRILHRIKAWLQKSEVNVHQVQTWFDWMEPLLRRDHYWSMFDENPPLLLRVMQLMGASNWSQQYLLRYPGVVSELVVQIEQIVRFDAKGFERLLQERRDLLRSESLDDEENLLALLRKSHHSAVFKILVQDLSGHLTLEQVADDLSALASSIINVANQWIWSFFGGGHNVNSPLSVVAYGKLGSQELGYGSDLDLVFLYDETLGVDYELINKIAKKLITWFTLKTQDGDLYEIDSALRPNGYSGLLVSEISSFERYQLQIDNNNAWTWEHQALTRARFCTGEAAMQERFSRIRTEVLSRKRDPQKVRADVSLMRQTMWKSSKVREPDFDLKQSPGGMIDVEFVVQFLILSYAGTYQELMGNVGNIALLKIAQNLNLLPQEIGQRAANAYRVLRKLQHQARLAETRLRLDRVSLLNEIQSIQNLWLSCFDPYW